MHVYLIFKVDIQVGFLTFNLIKKGLLGKWYYYCIIIIINFTKIVLVRIEKY